MVEDSILSLNALNGLPGPFIKYFEDFIGPDGIYRLLADFEDKSAIAKCHIGVFSTKNKTLDIFGGSCFGKIVKPEGDMTFGWDACFQPDGFEKPFSCLDKIVKNRISHRAKAFDKLSKYLNETDQNVE